MTKPLLILMALIMLLPCAAFSGDKKPSKDPRDQYADRVAEDYYETSARQAAEKAKKENTSGPARRIDEPGVHVFHPPSTWPTQPAGAQKPTRPTTNLPPSPAGFGHGSYGQAK